MIGLIYIKFINYIVNLITIQPEPTTSKNQDVEGNNKPLGLNNFPYHQQGTCINKDDGISERIILRLFILKNATHKKLA